MTIREEITSANDYAKSSYMKLKSTYKNFKKSARGAVQESVDKNFGRRSTSERQKFKNVQFRNIDSMDIGLESGKMEDLITDSEELLDSLNDNELAISKNQLEDKINTALSSFSDALRNLKEASDQFKDIDKKVKGIHTKRLISNSKDFEIIVIDMLKHCMNFDHIVSVSARAKTLLTNHEDL